MKKHPREPIDRTCPDIDKHIKCIKNTIYKDSELKGLNEEQLYNIASDMSMELYNCIGYLENLRVANDLLRKWGIEEAENVDQFEEIENAS